MKKLNEYNFEENDRIIQDKKVIKTYVLMYARNYQK